MAMIIEGPPKPIRFQLKAGEQLEPGDEISSPNRRFRFKNYSYGSFELEDTQNVRRSGSVIWSSDPKEEPKWGEERGSLTMQADGNLAHRRWSSDTGGQGNATSIFKVQDDGRAVISSEGRVIWDTDEDKKKQAIRKRELVIANSMLKAGNSLEVEKTLKSVNGTYALKNQSDGNIVLYKDWDGYRGQPVWDSNTWRKPSSKVTMQPDGNLVHTSWSSGTGGRGNASSTLVIQDSGVAVILSDGKEIWSTKAKN